MSLEYLTLERAFESRNSNAFGKEEAELLVNLSDLAVSFRYTPPIAQTYRPYRSSLYTATRK